MTRLAAIAALLAIGLGLGLAIYVLWAAVRRKAGAPIDALGARRACLGLLVLVPLAVGAGAGFAWSPLGFAPAVYAMALLVIVTGGAVLAAELLAPDSIQCVALGLTAVALAVAVLLLAEALPRRAPGDFSAFDAIGSCDTPTCPELVVQAALDRGPGPDVAPLVGRVDPALFACIGYQYGWPLMAVASDVRGLLLFRSLRVDRIEPVAPTPPYHVTLSARTIFGLPYESWRVECPSGGRLSTCSHLPLGVHSCSSTR